MGLPLTGAPEPPVAPAEELAVPDPLAVPDALLLPGAVLEAAVVVGGGVLRVAVLVRGAELTLVRGRDEPADVGPELPELVGWLDLVVALVVAGVLCGTVELPGEEAGEPTVSAR